MPPVAKYYQLPIRQGQEVVALRKVPKGFEVVANGSSYTASNLVVAMGYFDRPNPYDVPGAELPNVLRYYSEPYAYAGRLNNRIFIENGRLHGKQIVQSVRNHR